MWNIVLTGFICGVLSIGPCRGGVGIIRPPANTAQRINESAVFSAEVTDINVRFKAEFWFFINSDVWRILKIQDKIACEGFSGFTSPGRIMNLQIDRVSYIHANIYRFMVSVPREENTYFSLTVLDGPIKASVQGLIDDGVEEGKSLHAQYACSVGYVGKWEPDIVFLVDGVEVMRSARSAPAATTTINPGTTQSLPSNQPANIIDEPYCHLLQPSQRSDEKFTTKIVQLNRTIDSSDSGSRFQCIVEFPRPDREGMTFLTSEDRNPPNYTDIYDFNTIQVYYGPKHVTVSPTGGQVLIGTNVVCSYDAEPDNAVVAWYMRDATSSGVVKNCSTCTVLTLEGANILEDDVTPVRVRCMVYHKFGYGESPEMVYYPTNTLSTRGRSTAATASRTTTTREYADVTPRSTTSRATTSRSTTSRSTTEATPEVGVRTTRSGSGNHTVLSSSDAGTSLKGIDATSPDAAAATTTTTTAAAAAITTTTATTTTDGKALLSGTGTSTVLPEAAENATMDAPDLGSIPGNDVDTSSAPGFPSTISPNLAATPAETSSSDGVPSYLIAIICLVVVAFFLALVIFLMIQFTKPKSKADAYVAKPVSGEGRYVNKGELYLDGQTDGANAKPSTGESELNDNLSKTDTLNKRSSKDVNLKAKVSSLLDQTPPQPAQDDALSAFRKSVSSSRPAGGVDVSETVIKSMAKKSHVSYV